MARSTGSVPVPSGQMPDISNADVVVPLAIVGGCLMLMLIVWAFTRPKPSADDLSKLVAAQQPIVGQTQVTAAQLGVWHRSHGASVKRWIENHEDLLKKVSDDGLSIDLNEDLTEGHEALGPAIDQAIEQHPAPQMRAQLSALVLASRGTMEALRRSNWTAAEKEHIVYLEYRDTWLDRLRQFTTAESQVQQLRNIGHDSAMPGWLDRQDSPPG